ncbi:MAG: 50S ribosomal protein L34e [Candidatus Nanohalarchaeota archaeon]|nr:MAG: 50S ribosomal protein L34e [Candidatus Nanohaloarchaeota archaeon]
METRFRSGTYKKIKVRLPSGRRTMHFVKRKVGPALCAVCKTKLPGVASERAAKMRKISMAKKTVSRAYGGYMCAKCLRNKIKQEYISGSSIKKENDIKKD